MRLRKLRQFRLRTLCLIVFIVACVLGAHENFVRLATSQRSTLVVIGDRYGHHEFRGSHPVFVYNFQIVKEGNAGADHILLGKIGSISSVIHGNAGNDVIIAEAGDNQIFGDEGDDWLWGGNGTDILHGGAGSDYLVGGNGQDALFGDEGDDWLYGENGDDSLDGGDDLDRLFGGNGTDSLLNGERSGQ